MRPTGGSRDAVPEIVGTIAALVFVWPDCDEPEPIPVAPALPILVQVQRPPTPKNADLQLDMATIMARQLRTGHLYQHLPNSPIDWDLEGQFLEVHLNGQAHRIFDQREAQKPAEERDLPLDGIDREPIPAQDPQIRFFPPVTPAVTPPHQLQWDEEIPDSQEDPDIYLRSPDVEMADAN
ncbi:hypothetical protein FALBO_1412 [Fusarium albosuccineum]|uniref:Uncharacterized protein n=1 Tax=Fusarium albosuccineum TaxID=1237068 RepID=A0A8H4PDL5_9HYPO|nr:hypothetical protein FALBO_1412 [Fusarium albosuccineum]